MRKRYQTCDNTVQNELRKSVCVHVAVSQNRKFSIGNESRMNAWRVDFPPAPNGGCRGPTHDGL